MTPPTPVARRGIPEAAEGQTGMARVESIDDPVDSMESGESDPIDSDDELLPVDWRVKPEFGPGMVVLPRTPAGAYLAPSAVLPPLDDPLPRRSGPLVAPAIGPVSVPGAGPATTTTSSSTGAVGSRSAQITNTVAALELAADTPRRLIAAGAMVASLGFVLPWATVPGGDLIGEYLTRWGLAGPGHWIVVGLLVAVTLASLFGPTTAWPFGLIAVGTATLLVGLIWPYLFGMLTRSVGVWVVLFGAFALAAGGVLEYRRHARGGEPV
jgi:hypothetical protein